MHSGVAVAVAAQLTSQRQAQSWTKQRRTTTQHISGKEGEGLQNYHKPNLQLCSSYRICLVVVHNFGIFQN